MYDAIVIGARCAGSPTAMLLARKGYRVLLVDKGTFPSDIMSTHYIHQPGVACLKRWDLLDKVADSNAPPVINWTFDFGPFAFTGCPPPVGDVAEGYGPRRMVLDKILIDAAVEAGAELREGFSVQGIVTDGDRVTGIRGRGRGGSTIAEEARIVIGADGLHSIVARTVQASAYNERSKGTCAYYSYWSGVPVEGLEVYPPGERGPRAMMAFTTNDGLVCLIVAWPNREFHEFRADIEGNYLKTVDLVPRLADRVRNGKREERFVGTADVPNFFRKPYGQGWALVGDAGYHKDPMTAQGITDAFRDAELLVDAIDAGHSGRRPFDDALADYERQRNEAVMPMYEMTCGLASFEPPPPEMQQLFAALPRNQEAADRYVGAAWAGTVPISEFFSPENMQRIMAAA